MPNILIIAAKIILEILLDTKRAINNIIKNMISKKYNLNLSFFIFTFLKYLLPTFYQLRLCSITINFNCKCLGYISTCCIFF